MQVQRARRRSSPRWSGCGCLVAVIGFVLVISIAAVLLLLPVLPGLALRLAGFAPQGSTSQALQNAPASLPPVPVSNPTRPTTVTLNLGPLGTQTIANDPATTLIEIGGDGSPVAVVNVSEAGALDLCRERSTICSSGNNQLRNASIDFRPGAAVIYGELFIREVGFWQPVGLALRLSADQRQMMLAGVDIAGTLYSLPTGALGDQLNEVVNQANRLLREMSLDASSRRYTLDEIRLDETSLTLILR